MTKQVMVILNQIREHGICMNSVNKVLKVN